MLKRPCALSPLRLPEAHFHDDPLYQANGKVGHQAAALVVGVFQVINHPVLPAPATQLMNPL